MLGLSPRWLPVLVLLLGVTWASTLAFPGHAVAGDVLGLLPAIVLHGVLIG